MKNNKINIKTIIIILLLGIIIALSLIILNKNAIIEKQQINKEQLEEISSDNTYVKMDTHLSELNEQETKLLNFKSDIATAITNEGVNTSSDATTDTMSANIANILKERTKNATATAADIASGKTAWINGSEITGTATSIGTFTGSANLMSGATDTTVTTPTLTLNIANYTSITINVTSTYASSASLQVYTNNSSINTKLAPGTYTYDISSATNITFKYYCNISTYSNGTFSYTLNP